MTRPLVSVLIDTYNHERFIEQAIVSVLEQDALERDTDILVVDDGSTDRTPDIVRKFAPRVRYLRKENGGQASAFNAAIPECRGEIIAFLDGDDWWAREKLSRVTAAMVADSSLGIVGHGIVMAYPDGRRLSETLREGFCFRANTEEGARMLRVRGSLLGTSRMTIRAGLLRRIGPVPEALVVQADEYLSTLAAALAGVRILPDALTYYRIHEGNGFHLSTHDLPRLRRKQRVLDSLSRALRQKLHDCGIPRKTIQAIVGRIQADADQLRLTLDGGWPWETLKTELEIYRATHPEASLSHWALKGLALLPAMAIPPRSYYRVRRRLSTNAFYRRFRSRWMPVPEMPHIRRDAWGGT